MTYSLIWIRHEFCNESLLGALLALGADHVPTSLVESMDLLRTQIDRDLTEGAYDLFDEGLAFPRLQSYKMTLALVCDLDECITSHILDTCIILAQSP